jgi:hypothetical protein
MAANVELKLGLPITPAGDCTGLMHDYTSTVGMVETPIM